MQEGWVFCGEEPSKREVRASAELLRALQLWRWEPGGTRWPSRGLKTHSHNGRWSYLALLAGEKGARSWVVWKFGLKSGFTSLSEGRASRWRPTGGEIDFLRASENRDVEREPRSPVSGFRRRLNQLQQTLTIKPWIEPRPPSSPTPRPRWTCEHYPLFLLSRWQSQDVWVLPHPRILQLFSAVWCWFYVPSHHALLGSIKALI